jgi:hypothetical protein
MQDKARGKREAGIFRGRERGRKYREKLKGDSDRRGKLSNYCGRDLTIYYSSWRHGYYMAKATREQRPWLRRGRATKKPWDLIVGKCRDEDRYKRDETEGKVFATR